MVTPSTRTTLGVSSAAVNCTDRAALRYQIDMLRARLPLEEDTSVEIVWLAQLLRGMPVQPPRPQPLKPAACLKTELVRGGSIRAAEPHDKFLKQEDYAA